MKQKILGLILITISLAIPFACDGDLTASIIPMFIGLYAFLTKRNVLVD